MLASGQELEGGLIAQRLKGQLRCHPRRKKEWPQPRDQGQVAERHRFRSASHELPNPAHNQGDWEERRYLNSIT